jgi:hypothetical protein
MREFIRLLLVYSLIILLMCIYLPKEPYISFSNIDGQGVFSGRNYKENDIIYENIFPYKDNSVILFNPISTNSFNNYIKKEAKYLNHCGTRKNIDIITHDYRNFTVIATKDIKKNEELLADYNDINKKYPFIAPAEPSWIC